MHKIVKYCSQLLELYHLSLINTYKFKDVEGFDVLELVSEYNTVHTRR